MQYIYSERLRNLRENNNLTQQDISNLLEFKNSDTYGQFEREDTIIPIVHLNKLCNYFDCSIDYLFKLSNSKKYQNNKNEINKKLSASRLKTLRKECGLTQINLAKLISCNHSAISKYESQKNIISTLNLYIICKKYHISADYLLGKTDEPKYLK